MVEKNLKPDLVNTFEKDFCYKNLIIPIEIKDNVLIIGSHKPISVEIIEFIKLKFDKKIQVTIMLKEDIMKQLNLFYFKKIKEKNQNLSHIIVDEILDDAIISNASDIHIEPKEGELRIRNRINGVLTLSKIMQLKEHLGIVSKIKLLASMNISEKRKAQDGKIYYELNNKKYDLRVATIPTVYGEKVVIRILYKNLLNYKLENLNFSKENFLKIKKLIQKENGIVLVSGATGSGKSTTLYSILNEENKETINITTIEDPVEIYFDNFNQINVNEKIGLTFSAGLKHLLRQDPDIIMVGEIRDKETAKIALSSAITGHKVYSTIHTNSFYEVFSRLKEMGIENYLLLDSIKGIILQRLLGKLCEFCKESYEVNEEEKLEFNFKTTEKLYYSNGCNKCNNTGLSGRVLLSDVLIIDENEKRNVKEYLIRNNFTPVNNNIINESKELCLKGIISFEQYKVVKNGVLDD